MIYSGNEEGGQHRQGVGIIMTKAAQKMLRGWEAYGPRIIMASFTTKTKHIHLNIVQVYAPTNDASEEDKDEFYNNLQDLLDKLPTKDVNILMGDMNAQVGSNNEGYEQIMGKHGLGKKTTDNGERLKNLCALSKMIIGGTTFAHKRIHKTTWVSPDGRTENQIDHVCISSKFRRSLQDVRSMRGADAASDHHLVLAKVKLKLKSFNHASGTDIRQKFQVNLLQSRSKREEFKLELTNRFKILQDLDDTNVEEHWTKVRDIFKTTCNNVLGLKKTNNKPWITQESLDKIQIRRQSKAAVNNSKTRAEKQAAQAVYTKANKEVKRAIQKDKNDFLEDLAEKAEKAATGGHMRTVYQITKALSGKHSKPSIPVKDQQGNTILDKEGQMERWQQHFNQLLNRPTPETAPDILPARTDLPLNTDTPSKKEIEESVKQLRIAKAAGPDHIPPEALKADIPTTVDILHPLFEKIWIEEEFPLDWKQGDLIKLPKKGDLSNCANYRGITLLSIPGKVLNRIILNRMKDAVDTRLRDQQAGFRSNRSCTDQIATLRIIIEQSLEWKSSLYINFIDFEKAFDSLDRETLWKLMRHYGIPKNLSIW